MRTGGCRPPQKIFQPLAHEFKDSDYCRSPRILESADVAGPAYARLHVGAQALPKHNRYMLSTAPQSPQSGQCAAQMQMRRYAAQKRRQGKQTWGPKQTPPSDTYRRFWPPQINTTPYDNNNNNKQFCITQIASFEGRHQLLMFTPSPAAATTWSCKVSGRAGSASQRSM